MAAEQRRREQQTVLDQPHRLGQIHPWAESPLGRLCLRYKLRTEYYDAGMRYAAIVSCWRGAKGIPRAVAKSEGGRCSQGPDDEAVARWQKQMIDLERAMTRVGLECLLTVRTLVLDVWDIGADQAQYAKEGLAAIALELGLLRPVDLARSS